MMFLIAIYSDPTNVIMQKFFIIVLSSFNLCNDNSLDPVLGNKILCATAWSYLDITKSLT